MDKDVVLMVALCLVEESYISEALRLTWVCQSWRRALTGHVGRRVWDRALQLLQGNASDFNLPERDYLLDALCGSYPHESVKACIACASLRDQPSLDPRALCITFLLCEGSMVKKACGNMCFPDNKTAADMTAVWTARQVAEWEMAHQIVLPRILRRVYRYTWNGATFDNGVIRILSLHEVSFLQETPLDTLERILRDGAVGQTCARDTVAAAEDKPIQNQSETNFFLAQHLMDSKLHGINSRSIETLVGLPKAHSRAFIMFACAPSLGMYDQHVRWYFNQAPHIGLKPLIPSDPYSCSVWFSYSHEMAAMWEHQDLSGNGGWWQWSYCQLPESIFTWVQFIAFEHPDGNDCRMLGAFDQP